MCRLLSFHTQHTQTLPYKAQERLDSCLLLFIHTSAYVLAFIARHAQLIHEELLLRGIRNMLKVLREMMLYNYCRK